MVSEDTDYFLRKALSATVPVLWRSALSVRGADRGATAEGRTAEVAVAGETDGVRHDASRRDPRSRFRYDSFLHGSLLPTGYALDPSDPDVLVLLRPDGKTAAVFSSRGVTAGGVLEAAGIDRGLRSP
jgi:hypothetical protein